MGFSPKAAYIFLKQIEEADVVVIALVGERGREVREFIEKDLGPEGMKRAILGGVTSIEHGTYMDDEIMRLMKQHGTWYVPTLAISHLTPNSTTKDASQNEWRPPVLACPNQAAVPAGEALDVAVVPALDQRLPHVGGGHGFVVAMEAESLLARLTVRTPTKGVER